MGAEIERIAPTDLRPLFPRERAKLLELLRSLTPDEWALPAIGASWSVHDLTSHLLNGDLRFIAGRRDGYQAPAGPRVQPPYGRAEVTALVDRINEAWVAGAYFLSPRQLIEQLERSGSEYFDTLNTLDLAAIGMPVDWVAPGPAPVWIDVAREYTERWIHQAQLRDATGRPPLDDRWALYPVFDTFMLALPHVLSDVAAPADANVHVTVRGEAGCTWIVRKSETGWEFGSDRGVTPFAALWIDQDDAWRLYTKGVTAGEVLPRVDQQGDPGALAAMLGMVTVLA